MIGAAGLLALLLAQPGSAPGYTEADVLGVPLVVVTDASFRKVPGWRGLVQEAVKEASADLPETVGLSFTVGEERTWEPTPPYPGLGAALDSARAAVGPHNGILVVLTGRALTPGREDPEEGYAYLGEPALLIDLPGLASLPFGLARRRQLALLLRHELGHVYGIPHLSGNNVMNAASGRRTADFGDLGWDVLRANRTMELGAGSPFAGSDLGMLRDVYLLLTSRGEMETFLLINLGLAFEREGEPAEAIPLYELAIAREGESLPAGLGLARASLAAGDTATARATAAEMTARAPGDPALARSLGSLWLLLGELEAAEAELSLAIDRGGDGYYPRFKRGLARFRQGRYAEAVADYEAALAFEETPQAWFNLALSRDAAGNREQALRDLDACLALDPAPKLREAAERYRNAWSEGGKAPRGG